MKNILRRPNLPKLLLVLALLILGGAATLYSSHLAKNRSAQPSASINIPDGWSVYEDRQYGLQFIYPNAWGEPQANVSTVGQDKHYSFSFTPTSANSTLRTSIVISMDSGNDNAKTCSGGTCTLPTTSRSSVLELIKEHKSSFVTSDDSSYAIVANVPQQKISAVNVVQIVSLPKLNVSAATADYQILGGGSCAKSKFGANDTNGCVTQTVYNDISMALKSIRPL
jgi:hypothetical protein